jgi:hypothetical protein
MVNLFIDHNLRRSVRLYAILSKATKDTNIYQRIRIITKGYESSQKDTKYHKRVRSTIKLGNTEYNYTSAINPKIIISGSAQ